MTQQEIEVLKARVEELEICLKERKAVCHQAFDANEALKAERDALAAKAARLEKKITAINDGIAEYKEMANDATADLVHKALMDVREEIIQRDLYQSAPDFIEKFANEYAAKLRQGGAE